MRVDTRAGSEELIKPLRKWGLTVEECILPAGDVEVLGNGPEGRPILVGVEVKKIPDLLQCVRNGRFADQLRAMRQSYEVSWLLIEGRWAGFDSRKDISVLRGTRWYDVPGHISYQEVSSWTMTMAGAAGVLLWRTENEAETVAWLRALEMWWTSKDYEEHRAHLRFYTPPLPPGDDPFEEPTWVRKVANVLPGLAGALSSNADDHFDNVREMINAPAEEWCKIDGIAKAKANTLLKAITQGKNKVVKDGLDGR